MAQAIIWIPARVADDQPAGAIPDAVAGNGDAEKRVPACIFGSNEPPTPCRACKKPKLAPSMSSHLPFFVS